MANHSFKYRKILLCATISLVAFLHVAGASAQSVSKQNLHEITLGDNVTLHYVIKGHGDPILFIHGSLADYSYWSAQVDSFSIAYTAISYSRRYNAPNHNVIKSGYSAVTDANDAAALIRALKLGKVNIVGHSYGALVALFIAVRYPHLVRSIVLAEPPAISLLNHLDDEHAEEGKMLFKDIQAKMVSPMKDAFRRGDDENGVKIFIDYVLQDSLAWQTMSSESKAETMTSIAEWDAILKSGEFFPEITPSQIKSITVPVLILTGRNTYHFLTLIGEDLHQLLPKNKQIVLPDASHRMWFEKPDECRKLVIDFLWNAR